MSIQNRITLRLAGIMLVSMLWMAGVLHYEWAEQQRRQQQKLAPEPAWEETGEIVLFYGLPTAAILLAAGWWLLRQSLAPINRLTKALERIHVYSLEERIPLSGREDELDRLAAVFNSMLTRLQASIGQIREFTLHASHELKTPLTVMRAGVETALRDPRLPPDQREMLASHLDEIARLTRIVDSLALLAKADSGHLELQLEKVRLDTLLRDMFADTQMLAQATNLHVGLESCDEVQILGDRHRLKQLLLNLADNAVKYNVPDGDVIFSLRQNNGGAELKISNTGHGIPSGRLPHVFDRFQRGDETIYPTVEGSGLGLSIAKSITQAHGGTIDIASEPRRLTTVTVTLPSSPLTARPPQISI